MQRGIYQKIRKFKPTNPSVLMEYMSLDVLSGLQSCNYSASEYFRAVVTTKGLSPAAHMHSGGACVHHVGYLYHFGR